jgi:FeS assembly protein IscX
MGLRWTDVNDIAIALADNKTDINPISVNFVDLRSWILALPEFDDDPERCGEKILEAIQMAWIEELSD